METERIGNIEFIHGDCMEFLRNAPTGAYDLAIVDPPYSVGGAKSRTFAHSCLKAYGSMEYANDMRPTAEYFAELFRVAKNSIVWGYNHLSDLLPTCKEFLFWDKHQTGSYAESELAFTTFKGNAHKIDLIYNGAIGAEPDRIHPTQKPVKLYEWLLNHHAHEGYRILDTHGGSMSSAIACMRGGFDMTIIELNDAFYRKGLARFKEHARQGQLFNQL